MWGYDDSWEQILLFDRTGDTDSIYLDALEHPDHRIQDLASEYIGFDLSTRPTDSQIWDIMFLTWASVFVCMDKGLLS